MNRIVPAALTLLLLAGCEAEAGPGIAEVSVIDRDNGTVITPHYFHGEYWVAGRPGGRYAIEIHNRLGERVLAVTSVDGVNVVSGESAGWDQNGYVFGPGDRYQITGWRKSDAEVAAFTFTDSSASYAARTGRPANVGVIGVAIFREKPQPADAPRLSSGRKAEDSTGRAESSLAAPAASPGIAQNMAESRAKLGTGHGEREYSYVDHTEFVRMAEEPNQVIRLRYDSLDNLMAMGIIKRPRPQPMLPNPFPGSHDDRYVSDPPG